MVGLSRKSDSVMPMSSDVSEPPPHDARARWLALTASQLGAAHQVVGLPNQDAVAVQQIQPDAVVAAVADGHGHPPEWLADQLPLWASRCASTDGSADDTTIALLIPPSAPGRRHAAPQEPAADEVTTAAARQRTEPVTKPPVTPEREPAARSRRWWRWRAGSASSRQHAR
jgi:Protein phosphatase 2C